jgi:mannose-6-phosphate isomerase-like protein (cupin superfamily)
VALLQSRSLRQLIAQTQRSVSHSRILGLMSGQTTDSGIRRLMSSEKGRALAALSMSADWTNWEMHPTDDELLFMLEGTATFVLELSNELREIDLSAGRLLVTPQGVWHTAQMREPARLLAITAGSGTQHRPA